MRGVDATRSRLRDERGAAAIIFALLLVVLVGMVGYVIDVGRLLKARQVLQGAMDFGSLAGATKLPAQGAVAGADASQVALTTALANETNITSADVMIEFRCLVGDRDGDGAPDALDVPGVCGPTTGAQWSAADWTCADGKCQHACDPDADDKCNTIVLSSNRVIPYIFAPVVGQDSGNTGVVSAAACRGACGHPGAPLDVVMVLDRTTSMSPADLANVKNGALAVLDVYDSTVQWVGLVALPYRDAVDICTAQTPTQAYPAPPDGAGNPWRLVGLSNDYKLADGTLNGGSQLVSTISCLQLANGVQGLPPGAGHTDIGDPTEAAANILLSEGRPEAKDVIILMTDGEANQPKLDQPCQYAVDRATSARAAEVEIFTLGYGVGSKRCGQDTAGTYANQPAPLYLADAATPPKLGTDTCTPVENTDLDHFYCEAAGTDLEPVFRTIAEAALGKSRLVALP